MDLVEKAKKYVTEKVSNVPVPEASVKDVDLKGVSTECITYQATVPVKNPYPVSIPICEISYVLKSNGRKIASGNIPDPGSLKANDMTVLEIPAKVSHSVLLNLARDIGADWDIDYEIEIGLIIDLPVIGKFTIPLAQKGEIKLPTFSDMFGGGGSESKDEEKVVEN